MLRQDLEEGTGEMEMETENNARYWEKEAPANPTLAATHIITQITHAWNAELKRLSIFII